MRPPHLQPCRGCPVGPRREGVVLTGPACMHLESALRQMELLLAASGEESAMPCLVRLLEHLRALREVV